MGQFCVLLKRGQVWVRLWTEARVALLAQVLVLSRTGGAEDHQLQRRREVLQPAHQSLVLPQRERLGIFQFHGLECK